VVTRLEHIAADGTPFTNGRWDVGEDTTRQALSIGDYIRRLFGVDEGFYRVIVFVITDESFASTSHTVLESEALDWLSDGFQTLPQSQAAIPIKPGYACTALIYEFQKKHAQSPALLLPSDLGAQQHMIASGLWSALVGVSN
jgi:hypothetical protein